VVNDTCLPIGVIYHLTNPILLIGRFGLNILMRSRFRVSRFLLDKRSEQKILNLEVPTRAIPHLLTTKAERHKHTGYTRPAIEISSVEVSLESPAVKLTNSAIVVHRKFSFLIGPPQLLFLASSTHVAFRSNTMTTA
jgi:hypothetical protein